MIEQDRLIDAALDTLPLAPTPPGFTARVMARIEHPVVTFRLDFLDLALPAFFALFGAVGFGVLLAGVVALNPVAVLNMELQMKILLARLLALPYLLRLPAVPGVEVWLFAAGWCLGALGLALAAGLVWAWGGQRAAGRGQ